ncbi:MAG: hypothetical protein KIT84_30235 [Labilithrix sp.]|nr:hypothetical protein [Labilithrix sp.]MCW5815344.1 hypothetical protein [Labilithrix sp.]
MKIKPLRAAKAIYSLAQLVRDPNKLGQVFEMADALAEPARLAEMVERLAKDPAKAAAMDERHRFRIDLPALRRLPEGTLGRVFAEHMIAEDLDPAALPDLEVTDRGSFFRAHLYDTHDIWHAVTGFRTDVFGEIGLQAFYLAQIGGPLPSLLLAVGFLRVALYEVEMGPKLMESVARGWRMGTEAQSFFGVHWDELWHLPMAEVRRRLAIENADVEAQGVTALAA